MIVVVAPGQGSQSPGFLEPWLAEQRFRDHLAALSAPTGLDLVAHGTVSDAETIRDTAVAQPLIVAASLLCASALFEGDRRSRIGGVAGHSVGEVTAAALAGVLSEEEAMRFVTERGAAMASAAAQTQTGMSAVIGADPVELEELLERLALFPANYNGAGQVVVAGELPALQRLQAEPPAKARVVPLQVAGAFHTRYMQPAVERLREVAATLRSSDPIDTLWTNRDGSTVASGSSFLNLLVGQVSSPVRWDKTMTSFADAGVTGLIELAPAGALTGLAKRALRGVPTIAVRTPDDLPAAHQMIDAA